MTTEKKYAKDITVGDLALIAGTWECVEAIATPEAGYVVLYTDSGDFGFLGYRPVEVVTL